MTVLQASTLRILLAHASQGGIAQRMQTQALIEKLLRRAGLTLAAAMLAL